MTIDIKPLSDLNDDVQDKIVDLLVESFEVKFIKITENSNDLKRIIRPAIDKSKFFVAIDEEQHVLGFLSWSNSTCRAMHFNETIFKLIFGGLKGKFLCNQFNLMMGRPYVKTPDEGYIDFVCTAKEYRCKGVATTLISTLPKRTPYHDYYLQVPANNENAFRLYKKLGFFQVRTEKNTFSKKSDVKEVIIMRKTIHNK